MNQACLTEGALWGWAEVGTRTGLCADPVGDLGLAVAMEERMAEMKSEPLGRSGKGIGKLGSCLGRGGG